MQTPDASAILAEMGSLREELRDLKSFQFRLISVAGVATGFLLGLPRLWLEFRVAGPPSPLLWLLPLVVITPSWWLFFDKARTVTRIVGYYRNLEAFQRGALRPKQMPGWETALGDFRAHQHEIAKRILTREAKERAKLGWWKRASAISLDTVKAAFLVNIQRYWIISYLTFLVLTVLCLVFPTQVIWAARANLTPELKSTMWVLVLSAIASMYSAFFNAVVLYTLAKGRNSYDFLTEVWRHVLNEEWQTPRRVARL